MTKKEKLIVANLVTWSKATCNNHNGVKELLKEAIKEVEKLLTR